MQVNIRRLASAVVCLVLMTMAATGAEKPGKSSDIIAQAKKLLHAKKNADAVKLLQGAIADQEKRLEEVPKDDHAAFELAQLQFELQQDEAAAKSIELAISIRPKEAEYHAFQGKMLTYGDDKDAAERAYQKAIELAPKQGTYYHQYSQLLYTRNKKEAAEVQLRKTIEVEPGFWEAYSALATHRIDAGKVDEAKAILQSGIAKCPKNPDLRDTLGQLYQMAGKLAEARQQYLALAELEPANLRAQAKLVQLCLALGKKEESNEHLEKVYKIFRDGEAGKEWFCREQFTSGKFQVQAMEFFELKGVNPVKYRFQVMDERGEKEIYAVTLGSNFLTTEMAREAKTIKKDERMYHLDYYQGREHRTYGMFAVTPPSYDDVRKMVVEIIAGTKKPLSASVRKEDGKTELQIPDK